MIVCTGCFDGIHSGHVRYFRMARAVDVTMELVAVIASDDYIGESKERRSLWSQDERAEAIAGLRDVDRVVKQGPGSAAEPIRQLRPSIVVKGIDWKDALPSDVLAACEEVGARIVYVDAEMGHLEDRLGGHIERELRRRLADLAKV
jgi:cytidyltransferase-like protein